MRSAARDLSFAASLLFALVVAALPGTTSAATVLPHPVTQADAATLEPILVPAILQLVAVEGAEGAPSTGPQPGAAVSLGPTLLADTTVVSVYGHPGFCVMGELGCHDDPRDAVAAARALAEEYDALNGDRPALAALHLIVDVAQASPGADGQFLEQMPLDQIATWVEAARDEEVVIFLDLQIGWGELMEHVIRLEPFLEEPFVHLAIDPEFATESRGGWPGKVIGTLTAEQVNEVQHYLHDLVVRTGVPSKVLVLHQFREDMLTNPEAFEAVDGVEITIDMDGWGPPWPKAVGYERYALAPYAERPAFKLFFHWDEPLMTPADVMALPEPPAYVIYQ